MRIKWPKRIRRLHNRDRFINFNEIHADKIDYNMSKAAFESVVEITQHLLDRKNKVLTSSNEAKTSQVILE